MSRLMIVVGILTLLLAFSIVNSQQVRGNLEGRVVDADGNPLPAVNITVTGDDVQGVRGATTNTRGVFRVLALPVGKVAVTISHIGHQIVTYEDVAISLGKTTTLAEVRLTPTTIELAPVIVTSTVQVIDPNSTTVGANISAVQFEALPTERDFLSITTLLPQANASYLGDDVNIAGATGQENAYYIDGMNTTEMYRGIGSTNLPYNFVKEIEVKSGGYEAEYGRATGGIINVITHSGGNHLEAKAFGFLTDNRFAADRKRGLVELNTGEFSRYDAGLSVGGPLLRDKLWFFAAFNSRVDKEEVTFDGLGVRTDRTTVNTFAGKLTWQPQVNTNVMFTLLGDPTTRDRIATNATFPFDPSGLGNPDPFLGESKQGGVSFSLRADHLVSNSVQIQAALSRYNAVHEARASTAVGRNEPLFIDNTTGIWSGGYGEEFDRKSARSAASLTGTFFLGEHTLKAGAQFEDNSFDEYWMNDNEVGPVFGTIVKNADDVFLTLPWFIDFNVRNRVVSLFAQSSIALHSRLLINAGLRWEGQYLKGKETGFTHGITDLFQPRIGFVLHVGEIGAKKITGSFGRYYEQLPARAFDLNLGGLFQEAFAFDHNPLDDPSGSVLIYQSDPSQTGIDPDLKGEHFDEFTLGYESEVGGKYKLGLRGVLRKLREIIQNSDDPVTGAVQAIVGNPGRGLLAHMPKATRDYSALELTLEKFRGDRFRFLASYVLSRNHGNYTGLFSSDTGLDLPNAGTQFDNPQQLVNATGLLPNDRTHVLKFNGSYRFDFGLVAGTSFVWQSGTPLSEIGGHPTNPFSYTFLRERGTVGRTPSIWDLNLRFTYNLQGLLWSKVNQKLILDVFHLFGQRKAVSFVQQHFFTVDPATGQQNSENPNYLKPLLFQPPMTVRLGLEVGF